MEYLVSSLASLQKKLQEHQEMNITDEEADAVVRRVVDSVGVGTGRCTEVALVPVYTYVHQLNKTPKAGSPSIVVPAFASHWGVIVGRPQHQYLYHLLFVDHVGRETEDSTIGNEHIRFHVVKRSDDKPLPNMKHVGQTRYTLEQLDVLGTAMIREFGSYHRLFWNCQMFAKCYLRVITGDHKAKFDNWTSADTSRLFMCAFLVGTPFAAKNKVEEGDRAKQLISKIESIPNSLTPESESEEAIWAIYEALKQNPSWGTNVGQVEDTSAKPGFLNQLWKVLFGKDD